MAEMAIRGSAIDGHMAFVGAVVACDHAEQRCFAGSRGIDEADLLALLERRGSFDEENLVANLLADVVESDHVRLSMEIDAAALKPSGAPAKGRSAQPSCRFAQRPELRHKWPGFLLTTDSQPRQPARSCDMIGFSLPDPDTHASIKGTIVIAL